MPIDIEYLISQAGESATAFGFDLFQPISSHGDAALVRLVEWRMPEFKFTFTYVQQIPIYPPLYAQFGGSIGATIHIGFGYDTYGIQKFIDDPKKQAKMTNLVTVPF